MVLSDAAPPEPPYATTPAAALRRSLETLRGFGSLPDAPSYRVENFERLPAPSDNKPRKRVRSAQFAGFRADGSVFAVAGVSRFHGLPAWHRNSLISCGAPVSATDAEVTCPDAERPASKRFKPPKYDPSIESADEAMYRLVRKRAEEDTDGPYGIDNYSEVAVSDGPDRDQYASFRPDGTVFVIVAFQRRDRENWIPVRETFCPSERR